MMKKKRRVMMMRVMLELEKEKVHKQSIAMTKWTSGGNK